ncbi:MAG: LysR family transcriptional regulator [Pseudomonadota bacterium]
MRIKFDFLDLEAFLAVKETGSFHTASQHLGLSQSSITRRIQKLEAALDSVLFERTTRAVTPTLAAKRLQERAEVMLSEAHETSLALADESVAFTFQRAQSVTVASIPTVMHDLIAPAIRSLQVEMRAVRIRLLDLAANEVAEAVAQGEADIGVCSIPALEPDTQFDRLFDDPFVMAIPRDHPLAREEAVNWAQLSGENVILPARDTGNRMLIDDALARVGLPMVWTLEVGRTSTALELVAADVGIAPMPQSATGGHVFKDLCVKRLRAPDISRTVGLLKRARRQESPVVKGLINRIQLRAGNLNHA